MFATAQELSTLTPERQRYLYNPAGGNSYTNTAINYDQAVTLLEYWGRRVKEGAIFQKSNRPWHLIDLSAKLDPNRPWVGFEFETGFRTQEELCDVMGWVWDNTMHSCMDAEGGGGYPVELTFAPDYIENYLEGKSDIHRLYAYLAAKKIRAAGNRGSGTHANISLPYMRSLNGNEKSYCGHFVSAVINYTLQVAQPDSADRDALFGRNPYGWGAARDSVSGHLEFKLFQSSPDVRVFDRWVKVTNEILVLADNWLKENAERVIQQHGSWSAAYVSYQQRGWIQTLGSDVNYRALYEKHFRPIIDAHNNA